MIAEPPVGEDRRSSSPFAKLAALRDALPSAPTPTPPPPAAAQPDRALAAKIVVARTKRGRGGKTVTLITGIDAGAARLEELTRALKNDLGCGGTVEDRAIALQGDQIDRTIAWLESHGARQVIRGTR
jgi:translation initiation factor 1